jgi:hypothetical protein
MKFAKIYLLIFLIQLTSSSIFYINFKKEGPDPKKELIDNMYENDIITNDITFGTPEQKIPLHIKCEVFSLYVSSTLILGDFPKYDSSKSSTYKLLETRSYNIQPFSKAQNVLDTIKINNKEILKYNFIVAETLRYNQSGVLGLLPNSNNDILLNGTNIIKQLKEEKKITNSYAFTLNYTDGDNGQIIIGDYPHVYNPIYFIDDYMSTQTKIRKGNDFHWDIGFDEILYKNTSLPGFIYDGEIVFEFNLVLGSSKFAEFIEKDFFTKKIRDDKKCFRQSYYHKTTYVSFNYYYCDLDVNITEFGNITFSLKSLGDPIIFTPEELFKKEGDKYYFQFIFSTGTIYRWKLGNLFLKKLKTVVFDLDKKMIGRYTMKTDPKEKQKQKEDEYKHKRNTWIIVVILIIICVFLALYAKKLIKRANKKRRRNLIDEEYDYTTVDKIT